MSAPPVCEVYCRTAVLVLCCGDSLPCINFLIRLNTKNLSLTPDIRFTGPTSGLISLLLPWKNVMNVQTECVSYWWTAGLWRGPRQAARQLGPGRNSYARSGGRGWWDFLWSNVSLEVISSRVSLLLAPYDCPRNPPERPTSGLL